MKKMTWRRRRSELDDDGRAVGLPLTSAPSRIDLVLGFVGALFDGGKHWFGYPGVPLFYMALREWGPTPRTVGTPDQGARLTGFKGIGFPDSITARSPS
jgi:hypothetical protein